MAIEGDLGVVKWAWSVIMLPLLWVYTYIKATRTKVDSIQIAVYGKTSFDDTQKLIDRANEPIKEKLEKMSETLEYIRRNMK